MSDKPCPYILPIRTGGSFYAFSSATEDIKLNLTGSDKKVRLSKFALLDIPDIDSDTLRPINNTIKLRAIPGGFQNVDTNRTNDYNNFLAESFQNYCLNLEALLVSSSDYDFNQDLTVAERVFFKWLKEIGAIRYQVHSGPELRFKEESPGEFYSSVVKYLGDIEYINDYRDQTGSYVTAHAMIPTEVGSTPAPLFKIREDVNYSPGKAIRRSDRGSVNEELISGRLVADIGTHPAGLSIQAYYDNDTGLGYQDLVQLQSRNYFKRRLDAGLTDFDITKDYLVNSWWYPSTLDTNLYYTEPTTFFDPGDDDLAITESGVAEDAAVKFRRSRLDGVTIDWGLDSYRYLGDGIENFYDVNSLPQSKDFQFNAILFYYDVLDQIEETVISERLVTLNGEITSEGVPVTNLVEVVKETNLLGVLFLDKLENKTQFGGSEAGIPRYRKCRNNAVTKTNGDSYSFSLNFKVDISNVDVGLTVSTSIKNQIFPKELSDVLTETLRLFSILDDYQTSIASVDNRLRSLEDLSRFGETTGLSALSQKVDELYSILTNDTDGKFYLLKNASKILDSITRLREDFNELVQGRSTLQVAFNSDVLSAGRGMKINKQGQKLILETAGGEYNFSDKIEYSLQKDFSPSAGVSVLEIPILSGKNYIRFKDSGFLPKNHYYLYLKEAEAWSPGQTCRLVFNSPYEFKNKNGDFLFYVYTDFGNRLKNKTNYSKLVTRLNSQDFSTRRGSPILEVICVKDLTFVVDILN